MHFSNTQIDLLNILSVNVLFQLNVSCFQQNFAFSHILPVLDPWKFSFGLSIKILGACVISN